MYIFLYSYSSSTQQQIKSKINILKNKGFPSITVSNTCSIRAFTKKWNNLPDDFFTKLMNVFETKESSIKDNALAVDGSKTNLSKFLNKEQYPLNPNKNTTTGYIMGIYNITKESPEAMELNKCHNERSVIIKFVTNIKKFKDAILVFDRGYFSFDFA